MKRARILIADNHEITRIGVKSILKEHGAYDVCGEAENGREVLEQTRRLTPDVLVLDIRLPFINGIDVARWIAFHNRQTAALVFTEIDSEEVMLDSLRSGIKGFVLKSEGVCELLGGIDAVLRGHTWFNKRIGEILVNLAKQERREEILTAREREITQLVAEGYCTKEISHTLGVSIKTVETHRSNIMRKVNLHTTADLILYAVRNRIVHITQASEEISGEFALSEPLPRYLLAA